MIERLVSPTTQSSRVMRRIRLALIDRVGLQLRDLGHHSQVSTTSGAGIWRIVTLGWLGLLVARTGSLSDGIGKRFEIIAAGLECFGIGGDAHHLPTAWSGEAVRVHLTEVVAVRLGVRSERADHRGGIGIDIGERGYRRLGARRLGTTTTTHARHASAVIPR